MQTGQTCGIIGFDVLIGGRKSYSLNKVMEVRMEGHRFDSYIYP